MTSKVQIYSYPLCTTCKRALKWLQENDIEYELFDITKFPPTKEILIKAMSQIEKRKTLFNTSGLSYRKLGSKVVDAMSDMEAIEALHADGKLIKRPFLISANKNNYLIGFKSEDWNKFFFG